MKRIAFFHTALLGGLILLAGCTGTPTARPDRQLKTTPVVAGTPLPTGIRTPQGTVFRPSGSPAAYQAVDFSALPQWHNQPFTAQLESFISGCSKLKYQTAWRNVCTQAVQTPRNHTAARLFFEHYFTPWQVSEHGKTAGTVTGYYEPVLHGDSKPTAQARFPIEEWVSCLQCGLLRILP